MTIKSPSVRIARQHVSTHLRGRNYSLYLLPAIVFVGVGLVLFSSTGYDDTHITYWAAYSLAEFGDIFNYNGARVEQSSSLLLVLALAALRTLTGAHLANLGYLFSIAAGLATLAAVARLATQVDADIALPTALLAATSAYVVYWAFSGMETTLVAFTALILILTYGTFVTHARTNLRTAAPAGIATGLFVLVRPEMPIVLVCLLAGTILVVFVKRSISSSDVAAQCDRALVRLFVLFGIATIAILLLFLFRIVYFDSLFPQPVYAKAAGLSAESVAAGARYLSVQLFTDVSMIVLTAVGVLGAGYAAWSYVRGADPNYYLLFSWTFLGSYGAFILCSGGDWMEGGRFIAHALPVVVLFVALVVRAVVQSPLLWPVAFVLLLVLQLQTLVYFADTRSTGMPVWRGVTHYDQFGDEFGASRLTWAERTNRVRVRDIPTLYHLDRIVTRLSETKGAPVQILTGQMGMIPYYVTREHFGHVRFVDINAITERTFARCPATSHVPRTAIGLDLSRVEYFARRETIERTCDVQPDVVYWFGSAGMDEAEQNGFTVVYVQTGWIGSDHGWLDGPWLDGTQYIAVRNEYVTNLGEAGPTRVEFRQVLR